MQRSFYFSFGKHLTFNHLNASTVKICVIFLFIILQVQFFVYSQTVKTVGPGSDYTTLSSAFSAVNNGTLTGELEFQITGSFVESTTALLISSGSGLATYTSIKIYPTTPNCSIGMTASDTLINLKGSDNVTFDGRLNQTGIEQSLVFYHSGTASAAVIFQLIDDAYNNVFKYLKIQGANTNSSSGLIVFSTGLVTGNDDNTIEYCNLTSYESGGVEYCPRVMIRSSGTNAKENSGNVIRNNNISNYFTTSGSTALNLLIYNKSWTISNNRFFQESTRLQTISGANYAIYVSSGDDYSITNNIIGYSSANNTGTYNIVGNSTSISGFPTNFSVSGTAQAVKLIPIFLTASNAGLNSTISGNTIAAIAFYAGGTEGFNNTPTYGPFCGIYAKGNTTVSDNVIGGDSDLEKIYILRGASTGSTSLGIAAIIGFIPSNTSHTLTIENNIVQRFDIVSTNGASQSNAFMISLISQTTSPAGTYMIKNNLIGNGVTSSIRCGIIKNAGGNFDFNGTVLSAITNQGLLCGIYSNTTNASGIEINSNTIDNMEIFNSANSTSLPYGGVCGIGIQTGYASILTNKISSIKSYYAGTSADNRAVGIWINSDASGTKILFNNLIGNLLAESSGANPAVYGIQIGKNTPFTASTVKAYNNTIYLNSQSSVSTFGSVGLYHQTAGTAINCQLDLRNNIILNNSTSVTSANIIAYRRSSTTTTNYATTSNNNLFFSNGGYIFSDGTNAYANAQLSDFKTLISTREANSVVETSLDPSSYFESTSPPNESYLKIRKICSAAADAGQNLTSDFTTDYAGITRPSSGSWDIGALQFDGKYIWTGTTNTDFATATNWDCTVAPPDNSDIYVPSATNLPSLSSATTLNSVEFSGSGILFSIGDNTLTINSNITGHSNSNYIRTTGSGQLKRPVANGASVLFPVGFSAYNPVTITNSTGSADNFSASVSDGVYANGTNTGLPISNGRVNRTWGISKETANGGSGVSLSFQWNSGEIEGVLNDPRLFHNVSSAWNQESGTPVYDLSERSFSYPNYTGTFSPFYIGQKNTALPVTFLSLSGQSSFGKNIISWKVAQEIDVIRYEIERSVDGLSYILLDFQSAQSLFNYIWIDAMPLVGQNIYRIKAVDADGSIKYSKSILLNFTSSKSITLYPNPVSDVLNISLSLTQSECIDISIIDAIGRPIWSIKNIFDQGLQTYRINLPKVGTGIFWLEVKRPNGLQRLPFLKK